VKFQMTQSFCLDGDLDDRAFALGVEWGIVWQQAAGAAPFTSVVHAENVARIEAMLGDRRRRFAVRRSRGWATFTVAGLD
jgi:hypothetical protein